MRRRARIDANQTRIVEALRRVGCSVQSLAVLGSGVPDLLVARFGRLWLMELKDGDKPPSQRMLTDDEEAWIHRWQSPVYIVKSVDEALLVVGVETGVKCDLHYRPIKSPPRPA